MKFYLVRHGEVTYPDNHREGTMPGPGLNKYGFEQADVLAFHLKQIEFDLIFCSDMKRAKQTIEPLLIHSRIKPVYDQRFREFHGDFQSKIEQMRNVKKVIDDLKHTQNKTILIVTHYDVIKYLSEVLGKRIPNPEVGQCYLIEIK